MAPDLAALTRALSRQQIRSIVESHYRINIWSGAIRSGKTVASLIRFMMFLASDACPKAGRVLVIAQTRETAARNVFAVLQDPGIFGALAAEVRYTPGASTATILGRTVDVIGAHDTRAERRLRGLTAAVAYVDEATLLSQEFWTQLLGRASVRGARIFATTNPDSPAHWLRRDFILRRHDPAMSVGYWHFRLDDNPALPEEVKAAYKAEFVGLWFKRWILGHWVAAEGAIFDMFDEDRHVVDDGQVPPIRRWIACGVDYGTRNPFAAVMVGLGEDQRLYVVGEWYYSSSQAHRSKTDGDYSRDLRTWLATMPIPGTAGPDGQPTRGVWPEYTCVDPSASSFVVQLHRDGHTPTPARNSVLDGIRTVAMLLGHDRLRVHRSAKHLIEEIPGYSWDDEKAMKGIDEPIKVDDHACDALRYALFTTESIWRPALGLTGGLGLG